MRITKREMVKEMFLLATQGKRTRDNFADGQYLIDMVAEHNWAWLIKESWEQINLKENNVRSIFNKLCNRAIDNLKGVNFNHTERSLSVQRAFLRF